MPLPIFLSPLCEGFVSSLLLKQEGDHSLSNRKRSFIFSRVSCVTIDSRMESEYPTTSRTMSEVRRSKVQFSSEAPPPNREESIQSTATAGTSCRTSETSGGEHVLDVEIGPHSCSEDEFESYGLSKHRVRSPFIDVSSVFGDDSMRTSPYHDHENDGPELDYNQAEEHGGNGGDEERSAGKNRKKSRENAPEKRITIFALRLALIEKGASGLGTLSFLWATVVILGGFATSVNETDFWVVTVIILAESSRIFSRSHELEWQQLSVRSHESLGHRFVHAASASYLHNITFAREVKERLKSFIQSQVGGGDKGHGNTAAAATASRPSPTTSTRRRTSRKPTARKPSETHLDCKTKDQIRTWNAPSLPLLPYTHHLLTTKLVSRLLYAIQLLSAIMSIALAIWRLQKQDFFYNPGGNQPKPPNITVSMNVFYILSVIEAGMFLLERVYWEYRIRITELLQNVNKEAELGPENLVAVQQFFYEVYSQCLKGSVFDGLEMDLVSFSISWLQAEDFKQQLGGARLLNRIVSQDNGKPRTDDFAADCLRRLGTTPGIIERLVEMLSWNSKQEQPLLREVSDIICRLVVYNRNCSRIVAIPGSIEGIINLLLSHEKPSPLDKMNYSKQTTAYLELRVNGLRILKYLSKDQKNCLRIGEAKGLLSILILFIEVRGAKAFQEMSSDKVDQQTAVYQLKTYKKSLQIIGLLAAATNTSGGLLRSKIAAVVSGLKNLRDVIEFCDSQPELQMSSVEILFHLAMDPEVRKTIGATGGIISNLYNLFASYDDTSSDGNSQTTGMSDCTQRNKKNADERHLASEMAGRTLTRIALQNQKNCLKLMSMKSERQEPFLKCMVKFLAQPLETDNTAPRETASCSANILRSVLSYADDGVKRQVAEDSARIVLRLIQKRIHQGRSSLYESYLGLASRIIEPLSHETYSRLFGKTQVISKTDLLQQILRNLKHTPSTNRFPRIRRYCIELLIVLSNKDAAQRRENLEKGLSNDDDDSFLNIFRRERNVSLVEVLSSTLDSISEVENFCLFSGLVGYARHSEEMEELVNRAIQHVKSLELAENHP